MITDGKFEIKQNSNAEDLRQYAPDDIVMFDVQRNLSVVLGAGLQGGEQHLGN
jgi:hypothetical protein